MLPNLEPCNLIPLKFVFPWPLANFLVLAGHLAPSLGHSSILPDPNPELEPLCPFWMTGGGKRSEQTVAHYLSLQFVRTNAEDAAHRRLS